MEELIKEYLNLNASKYAEFVGINPDFINNEDSDEYKEYKKQAIDFLEKGGLIPKFENPAGTIEYNKDIPEWFLKYRLQPYLTNWTEDSDSSQAGENLTTNQFHHKYGDLTGAWNTNQAYTSNKDIITSDLNLAYNNGFANQSLLDFVTNYNSKAGTIRDRWLKRNDIKYRDTDASVHNDTHKLLFASRNSDTNNPYDLGWSESSKAKQGSTTWMRNMDLYEKEWKDLTDEEKKNRIHKIGNLGYVYKEANGDINIVDDDTLKRLGLGNSPESPQQPKDLKGISIPQKPNTDGNKDLDPTPLLETAKFIDANKVNKDMKDLFQKNYKYATEEYTPKNLNIYGDLAAVNQAENQAADLESLAARQASGTSDYRTASAINLEGNVKGNQIREAARLKYNDLVRSTAEKATALAFDNIDKQQAVANENFARGIAAHNVKLNNLLEYKNLQHANRKAYMDYWELKLAMDRQNKNDFRNKILAEQYDKAIKLDPEVTKARELWEKDQSNANWDKYIKALQLAHAKYSPIYYQQAARNQGINYDYIKENPFIGLKKNGGKVTDDGPSKRRSKDLERLRKERRDWMHYNDKKLDRLGRLTYLYAKRAQGKK